MSLHDHVTELNESYYEADVGLLAAERKMLQHNHCESKNIHTGARAAGEGGS